MLRHIVRSLHHLSPGDRRKNLSREAADRRLRRLNARSLAHAERRGPPNTLIGLPEPRKG